MLVMQCGLPSTRHIKPRTKFFNLKCDQQEVIRNIHYKEKKIGIHIFETFDVHLDGLCQFRASES